MSIKAYAWAKSVKTGSATLKAVLCCIADYADDKGRAWPSMERIASDTEFSGRAVRMAVSDLAELGLVIRQQRFRPDGGRSTDILVLQTHMTAPLERGSTPPERGSTPPEPRSDPPEPASRAPRTTFYPRTTIEPSETRKSPSETCASKDAPRSFPWPSDFEKQFWDAYPRKTDRKKAMAALGKVYRQDKTPFAAIIAGCQRLHTNGPEAAFLPHATTWLNGERWNDEIPVQPTRQASSHRPERTSAITAFADRLEARYARRQHNDHGTDQGSVIDHESNGRPHLEVHEPAGGQARRFSPETPLRIVGSRWG